VEFDADRGFPVGLAWVQNWVASDFCMLIAILVFDDVRRQGIATALVEACRERWPNIELSDACTDDGERFLEALTNE
jgi:hypothetical protein